MLICKVVRQVATGNVYKTIFPHAIKHFGVSNNPMAVQKTTNEKATGTYRITIRTLDRKEYHLTDESFNYNAVCLLAELVEAKLGLRVLKDRHMEVLKNLDENDREFFTKVKEGDVMIHAEKLNNTLKQIETTFSNR
ncbi:hypothetical protein [uncultured Tyzzerella sp.]|uniref:hypothetical protein n=1 Tax=uncultured Tyzzerella sp. TaxID=2321398 RepID=UPI0029426366|nr:hypothetical protein [uncultured Tyzzerella sp.]